MARLGPKAGRATIGIVKTVSPMAGIAALALGAIAIHQNLGWREIIASALFFPILMIAIQALIPGVFWIGFSIMDRLTGQK